jgi:hypothetical protein
MPQSLLVVAALCAKYAYENRWPPSGSFVVEDRQLVAASAPILCSATNTKTVILSDAHSDEIYIITRGTEFEKALRIMYAVFGANVGGAGS